MSENKQIAKNTLFLFLRQLLAMIIAIYASRVILEELGVEDFGIFKLVEGFVAMFIVISGAMTGATNRFLTIELAKKDVVGFQNILNLSITTYYLLIVFVLLIGETVGLWFLNTQLVIPKSKYFAANIVYHCSLLMTAFSILSIPYNAVIIAHEKMAIYAYLSLIDAVFRLVIVLIIPFVFINKLVLYASLSLVVSIIIFAIYRFYTIKKFNLEAYRFYWDKILIKKIISFSGWTFLGSSATMGTKQGINILLNTFAGVSANAAFGIAFSFNNAINSVVSNFTVAYRPQIIKLYINKETDKFNLLLFRTSKYSYFLVLLFAIPCLINTESLLIFWLRTVPKYTVVFSQLLLVPLLIDALQSPLAAAISATGKIKIYQIWQSSLFFLVLPISYSFLIMGYDVSTGIIIWVGVGIISAIVRTFYLMKLIGFPAFDYFNKVVINVLFVSFLAFLTSYFVRVRFEENFINLVVTSSLSFILTGVFIYFIGINKSEKAIFTGFIMKFVRPKNKISDVN